MAPQETLTPFISLGLGGVMGVGLLVLLGWVLIYTLPKEREAFLSAIAQARVEYLKSMETADARYVAALSQHSERSERSTLAMAAEIKEFSRAVRELEKRG